MNDSTVSVKSSRRTADRWLLLVHQIPPKPDYFRVKVRRRLQRIGAVALKNSVYVLPSRPELEAMFAAERDADYAEIASSADGLGGERAPSVERSAQLTAELGRIRSRLDEVAAIDYFEAPGRKTAERA